MTISCRLSSCMRIERTRYNLSQSLNWCTYVRQELDMADEEAAATETRVTTTTTTGAPPKYYSVSHRLRSARERSTSKAGLVASLPSVFAGTIQCTICLGVMLVLPISMIVMGAIYKNDCPIQRMIPIYLIVGGIFALFVNLVGMFQSIFETKEPPGGHRTKLSVCCNFFEGIVGCFVIIWFIAGNVWIYSTYGKFTTEDPMSSTPASVDTYCHPTLYWYAFWLTTAGYILLGAFLIGICVCFCCVFLCASLFDG